MGYPKGLYKNKDDYITVNSLEEEIQAAKIGYSHYAVTVLNRDPKSLGKPVIAPYKDFIPHRGNNIVETTVSQPPTFSLPDVMEPEPGIDRLIRAYEKKTGKKAVCDRGPHKGKKTKGFIKWAQQTK